MNYKEEHIVLTEELIKKINSVQPSTFEELEELIKNNSYTVDVNITFDILNISKGIKDNDKR